MRLYSASSSFTRPANTTSYGGGVLIANDTVAANVVPMTFAIPTQGFLLTNSKLIISASSNTTPQIILYLFQFSPAVVHGDGGSFQTTQESGFLGSVYYDTSILGAGTLFGNNIVAYPTLDPNSNPIFTDNTQQNSNNQIYGLLSTSALGSWSSPASGATISVTLVGVD